MTPRQDAFPAVPLEQGGIVVGETFTETGRFPLLLPLVGPRGSAVVLVGGLHLAALVAVRAVAAGMRVCVETARAERWIPTLPGTVELRRPDGRGGRGSVPAGAVQGTADEPLLVVRDLGARPPPDREGAGAWRASLTLLPFLDRAARALVTEADAVGLQRLSPQESDIAAAALGLAAQERNVLPALSDVETLWCAAGHARRAMSVLTGAEADLLGAPRRVD